MLFIVEGFFYYFIFLFMDPTISVIIVTYHANSLTHLCLWSLAQNGLKHSEVIVVDNTGNDPYYQKISSDFPFVKIIRNATNEGFGKACNRAFRTSRGEIILFLNPDTIVPEDFEHKIINFFETHPRAGAMGTKMIDGYGHFQKESKRNFPRPLAAIMKFTKLSKCMPPSFKRWHYYAQHIAPETPAETEILSGSFMAVTRQVMLQTGGFDPRYFLYAEDIDFSWLIARSGFEVWYNPDIVVVHLKGETTKRSPTYIRDFYQSMIQFYYKHYSPNQHPLLFLTGITTIKSIAFFSSIRHRYRTIFPPKMPSKVDLHPNSCMVTYENLRSSFPFQVRQKQGVRKKHRTYLLLSTGNLSPKQLIGMLEDQIDSSCRMMLWHEQAQHLILLSNAHHCSLSIPLSEIK